MSLTELLGAGDGGHGGEEGRHCQAIQHVHGLPSTFKIHFAASGGGPIAGPTTAKRGEAAFVCKNCDFFAHVFTAHALSPTETAAMRGDIQPSPETKLALQCQQGDRAAFAELVELYWERVYRWLNSLAQRTHIAEDLTQDTFCKAWTGIGSFREGAGFRPWLFRIARNNWIDYCRAKKERLVEDLPDVVSPGDRTPLAEVVSREGVDLIIQEIQRLPEIYRESLLLRISESMSFAEMALVIGEKEETVRWRVYMARQKLLKRLSDRERVESLTPWIVKT